MSSVDLELKGKRLVYEVKVLNKSKRATEVTIDAMTGEVVKLKRYGGHAAPTVGDGPLLPNLRRIPFLES